MTTNREIIHWIIDEIGYVAVLEIIQQIAEKDAAKYAATDTPRAVNFAALDCETISLQLSELIKNVDI